MTRQQEQDQENQTEVVRVVLLANQPRMLREMLHRALLKTPGLQLVFEVEEPDLIARVLDHIDADWLITSLTSEQKLQSTVQQALEQKPSLSIIGVSEDGSHVEVYMPVQNEVRHDRRHYSLNNISLANLLSILRKRQTL